MNYATVLSVLGRAGDMKLTWDHSDPAEVERVRGEVEQLKVAGYTFFLLDGTPADEVAAGQGELVVRRLTAAEVLAPESEPAVEPEPDPSPEPVAPSKRRGRPPKANRNVVAVRPMSGG